MSSKLSFRSRQVDYTKPLPIYFADDVPDLTDITAINRSVPQMPTGMEKDEESEHHLQRALSALQAFGSCATTSSNEYAIPTPKVDIIENKLYDRIYAAQYQKTKQYIRIQPFSNDYDYPDYDADYDDEDWLNEQRSKLAENFCDDLVLFFENIIDRLEKATGHSTNLMSRDEAKLLLTKENPNEDAFKTPTKSTNMDEATKSQKDEFILCIYEYWKEKRLKYKHPLTPTVLTDKSGVVTQPNNPYLVFRRRTEKMQTRKNRKTEEQSYEKMLILKHDLMKAQQILKLIKQRENLKKELLKVTLETFEKRYKANDYDGHLTESIKAALRPASSGVASTSGSNYGGAFSALSNSSNSQLLTNFQNRINNINKNNAGSVSGVASSIERTIASLIGSKSKPFSSPNMKNDVYESSQITVNKKRKDQRSRAESVNSLKKGSPPQAGSAMGVFKKPPPLTVNQLTSGSSPPFGGTSLSTKNRLIRRLASNRSLDSSSPPIGDRNSDKSVANYLVECNEYDEELRLNEIDNLDALLNETQNKLSTSVEKDGYWCFRRKEGCRYLAQNGSIFKHDAFDYFNELNSASKKTPDEDQLEAVRSALMAAVDRLPATLNTAQKRKRARELQRHYCGYAVDAVANRHLGLVRRRVGRGGRVLMERVTTESVEKLNDPVINTKPQTSSQPPLNHECLSSFKTYYPLESASVDSGSTIFAVVPNINSKRLKLMEDDSSEEDDCVDKEADHPSDRQPRYDHRLYLTHSYEYDSSRLVMKRSRSGESSFMDDDDHDDSIASSATSSDDDHDDDDDRIESGPTLIRLRSSTQTSHNDSEFLMSLNESHRRQALRAMVRLRLNQPVKSNDSDSPKRAPNISPPTPPPSSSSSSSSSTSSIPASLTNGHPGSPIKSSEISLKINPNLFYSNSTGANTVTTPNGPSKMSKQDLDVNYTNHTHQLVGPINTNGPPANSLTSSSASPSSSSNSTTAATNPSTNSNSTLINIIQPDLVT